MWFPRTLANLVSLSVAYDTCVHIYIYIYISLTSETEIKPIAGVHPFEWLVV